MNWRTISTPSTGQHLVTFILIRYGSAGSRHLKNAEETLNAENLMQHPNAKEWLIAAAKSDYQLLAKLSTEHPSLVKLSVSAHQDLPGVLSLAPCYLVFRPLPINFNCPFAVT
uniref:Uncharacterized protein n=1 Tax=Anopheles culicifacies TaxID=139723 RepID=A0A182M5R3_9DIPT